MCSKENSSATNNGGNLLHTSVGNSIHLWESNLMQHGSKKHLLKNQQNICFAVALRKWFYKYLCTTLTDMYI